MREVDTFAMTNQQTYLLSVFYWAPPDHTVSSFKRFERLMSVVRDDSTLGGLYLWLERTGNYNLGVTASLTCSRLTAGAVAWALDWLSHVQGEKEYILSGGAHIADIDLYGKERRSHRAGDMIFALNMDRATASERYLVLPGGNGVENLKLSKTGSDTAFFSSPEIVYG